MKAYKVGDRVTLQCACHKGRLGTVIRQGEIPMVCLDNPKSPDEASLFAFWGDLISITPLTKGGHPRFYELSDEERTLHGEKNTDYAKGGDALGNFKRVSAIKKLYPDFPWETATGTCIDYMLKQLDCAMWMLCQKYEGKVETFGKRMLDVSVYSKLAIINKEEESL